MLQTYWGCGRIHPSTDGISGLNMICVAYDLVAEAKKEDGSSVWSEEEKLKVERDFILEYVIGAEPFVGGEGRADEDNNKAPRVYNAQAAVAKCLGIPELADVAIRGYEIVRDNSFLYDGMSTESPSYTNMYLSQLIAIPETLYGFKWPKDFEPRKGVYDPYANDKRLELMYRAVLDQLDPHYHYLPLSDTHVDSGPSRHIIEYGLKRFPEYFSGKYPAITGGGAPDQFALFYLDRKELENNQPFHLPEIYFPAWMTSIFRQGRADTGSVLSLVFNPKGGHRHQDNLSLYYFANGNGVLGDQGYVGDMPINRWIRSTKSHNLVVVDDSDQIFYGDEERVPALNLLATSPKVSFIEAESKAYPQCSEYRRLAVFIKGPHDQTFAVDFFRVRGGNRHDYRLYSELASSDGTGELRFEGIEFPQEPPLPEVGSSLDEADIYGLRDLRTVQPMDANWRAIWEERGKAFRFWNLSEADEVTASNAPGQRSREEIGRRVRYLDVTRKGTDLNSLFVGVHEPTAPDGGFILENAKRLEVPDEAGPDAAVVRIETNWGAYTLFNEFENEALVDGFKFKGKLGIHCEPMEGAEWILASSAETFLSKDGNLGFEGREPSELVNIESSESTQIETSETIPDSLIECPDGFQNYFLANDGSFNTGYPIDSISGKTVTFDRFEVPELEKGQLPNLIFAERDGK
ncbi:MAG: heparinase II/III family protein [Candidatus Omnitrophica bacterium]|nr:heparinase II/III family protein [Candidatus Omnitrophota bacterium]